MQQLPQLFGRTRRRIGLGDAMVLTAVDLSSGSLTFQPNTGYAVLASVGTGTSLATISGYVGKKSFEVSYICEPGSNCTRSQYDVDTWLSNLAAKPRSGERWVYAEGLFTGTSPWSVDVTDAFPKTLVATYSISNAFTVTGTPTTPAPPSGDPNATTPTADLPTVTTPPGTASSSAATGVVVAGSVVGLAAAIWWLARRRKR